VLLREILGPPTSLPTAEDTHARPSGGERPLRSRTTQPGQHQNSVSAGAHNNGHTHVSPGIADDCPPATALPPASPEPVGAELPATAPSPEARTSSPSGMATGVVDAAASAVRRFFRHMGIRL
jgi:hypothetical protein